MTECCVSVTSRGELCPFSCVIPIAVGGRAKAPQLPEAFFAHFLLSWEAVVEEHETIQLFFSPVFSPGRRTGWIPSAPAEGIRNLTENICTLLWPNNYQQWDWWNHQAPGGSHRARVYSLPVGPGLLGLLDREWENWGEEKKQKQTNLSLLGTTSYMENLFVIDLVSTGLGP